MTRHSSPQPSRWLDKFDQCVHELSTLTTLCFYQGSLLELLKESADNNFENIRYAGALGTIAEESLQNVTPVWPVEVRTTVCRSFDIVISCIWAGCRGLIRIVAHSFVPVFGFRG